MPEMLVSKRNLAIGKADAVFVGLKDYAFAAGELFNGEVFKREIGGFGFIFDTDSEGPGSVLHDFLITHTDFKNFSGEEGLFQAVFAVFASAGEKMQREDVEGSGIGHMEKIFFAGENCVGACSFNVYEVYDAGFFDGGKIKFVPVFIRGSFGAGQTKSDPPETIGGQFFGSETDLVRFARPDALAVTVGAKIRMLGFMSAVEFRDGDITVIDKRYSYNRVFRFCISDGQKYGKNKNE